VFTSPKVARMDEQEERIATEVALLESMYPDQLQYNDKAREVRYKSTTNAFVLRLPNGYLSFELPEVLSASAGKHDLREPLKARIKQCALGEEVLDSVVSAFDELAAGIGEEVDSDGGPKRSPRRTDQADQSKATIVVWLHHLLNTNKRKLALSPSSGVSGITKPGYPGVLIYAGPSKAVHEHVNELKQQNWAVFQVRLEDEEEWTFSHGAGVREVEAMKDIVAEVGASRKELFMEAMRMK